MNTFDCYVPWFDGRPLINAVGSTESEARVNLGLLDLSDQEVNRVRILPATLQVASPGEPAEAQIQETD